MNKYLFHVLLLYYYATDVFSLSSYIDPSLGSDQQRIAEVAGAIVSFDPKPVNVCYILLSMFYSN